MTVTETKMAMGAWDLTLRRHTPRAVLDQLGYFGHIVILPGRVNPVEYGDSLLASARYVGVLKSREDMRLSGCGMAFWLGDDEKGDVYETPVTLNAATFAASMTALLPPGGAVTTGTIYSIPGTYTGTHRLQTPRKAYDYVTGIFNAEWRINGDGKLDAGLVSDLYRVNPRAVLVRKGDGEDLTYVGLPGEMSLTTDVEDYTTRVVLLGEGEGESIALGDADAVGVTAKDIHGNPIKITRLVSESETSASNADARAALALASVSTPRSAVSLSSSAYDVQGDVKVGDYLHVYDPDQGFTDPANQVTWNGEVITPVKLRCTEMTWPVRQGWTVAFRTVDGVWVDLSDYYHEEGGSTTIVVGEFGRDTSSLGSEPVGGRPNGDSSTPSTPVFIEPFVTAAYQSAAANDIRAAVLAAWTTPLNVDGSTVLDGHHFELRYRTTQVFSYPVPWATMSGFSSAIAEPFDHTASNSWGNGWTVTGGPTTDYNSTGGSGRIFMSAANSGRRTYKGSVRDGHFIMDVRNDMVSAVANAYCALNLRHDPVNDHGYMVQLRFNTDSSLTLRIIRRISGAETQIGNLASILGPDTLPLVHNTGIYYRVEATLQNSGGTTLIKARAYPVGNAAPNWQLQISDSTAQVQVAGTAGVRAFRGAGSTSANTFYVDNYNVTAWGTGFTWDEAQTWARPLSSPATSGEWQTAYAPWDNTEFLLQELTVAAQYEIQIRAVDSANPPNMSAWSSSSFITTGSDLIPPAQPAAPEVAGSRIAIMVIHRLGQASGGEFNLAPDMHHFEVHVGPSAGFLADETTIVGTLPATEGNIVGRIPVVGTFPIEDTEAVWVKVVAVDRFGNKSSASEAVTAQAELIDSAHISDLSASKITAGTITSNILLAATIKTAESGQRAELNQYGLQLFDENGDMTVNITADDSAPNFFAVTNGPEQTLASIDQEGNVNGQTINAALGVNVEGQDLMGEVIDPLPKGILAYGEYSQADHGGTAYTGIAGAGNQDPFMELAFVAEAGRRYRVKCNAQLLSSVVNEEYAFELRDGGDGEPSISSPRLTRSEIAGGAEAFAVDLFLEYLGEFTPGEHRLLWTFMGFDGQARIHLANHPATMYIEDCGSSVSVSNSAVMRTDSATPPPVVTYEKTYNCNWYGTYNGSNAQISDSTANQGQYSTNHDNQRSLLGFPYTTISSDLAGAEVISVKVTLYAEHWYYNAGGTAIIGWHNYASKPSTWTDIGTVQDQIRVAKWPKPGKKTVDITAFAAQFKSGQARGIALGPGPSTSWEYYGKFSTNTAGTVDNRPTITIKYKK